MYRKNVYISLCKCQITAKLNRFHKPHTLSWFCDLQGPQLLVTIHVNILSMHKHVQGRAPFLPPLASSRVCFLNSLLIYSKPCLVQLPRPYSFKKIWPPLYYLLWSRLSRELHWPTVKVTALPIKKTEVWNSQGFSFEVRKISFNVVWILTVFSLPQS